MHAVVVLEKLKMVESGFNLNVFKCQGCIFDDEFGIRGEPLQKLFKIGVI